ncbi:MAG: NusG domain II-containing protein [Butyrivibrio sp.]|nr:NusG domain II-containing protein [Acetatifactor muris]MCM1559985.1 NusG domain II-containing protein [Butyrivibrio sp.]
MNTKDRINPAALLIGCILMLLSVVSLLCILLPQNREDGFTADIYRNGKLIASIPLDEVQEPRRFTVTGEGGCTNEIEVRPGSIGIISADCPDRLCVHQGFISDSRLPVTCLPNRIVILLRPNTDGRDGITPDIITY